MTSKRSILRIAAVAAVAAVAVGGIVALSSGASYGGGSRYVRPTGSMSMPAYGHSMGASMAMAQTAQRTSSPVAGTASASTVHVTADPHGALRFTTTRLSAHRGTVRIVMSNPRTSGMAHGIAIQGRGVHAVGRIVGPGSTTSVTARLNRGTYTYFCPVPGHAAAGMTGTLHVA
ncbi:MAG TPA: plastocyanin/azurin family copper-binding protein [Baekduia sp.]|nr:plastocyanin/azurin family copper-binding protein [Baekduia sp.]